MDKYSKFRTSVNHVLQNFNDGINYILDGGSCSDEIILRTKPLYAEWVSLDKNRERKVPFELSIMSPPGTYNVHLKLGDDVMTQKLEVIKDPHSEGTMEDIALQHDLMKKFIMVKFIII